MKTEKVLSKENVLKLEEEALKKVKYDPWRMHFHLMPPSGWLNDPNGLSEQNGTNHIFFQYTPQDIKATTANCWGHYTTKDFINYTYLLPPLYPDTPYETNGVYSGSAITTPEGIKAYYTGNVKHPGDYDYIHEGREQNLILAENYDPETGEFKSKVRLMTNEDYPEEMTLHVRDPKVVKRENKLYMFLGGRTKDDIGSLIVYESEDGKEWNLHRVLKGDETLGYMWECPDGIQVDGQEFLIISPQGIEPDGYKYQNVYQAGYLPIFNEEDQVNYGDFEELDNGFDFYAPQTYTDEEGRIILIGWMGIPDADYEYPTTKNGWIHALTIPRALTRKGSKLIQSPIQELKELRSKKEVFNLNGEDLFIETPKTYEFILDNQSSTGEIIINNACILGWKDQVFELSFESENEKIKEAGAGRTVRKVEFNELRNLRVFVDTSSIEVFLNGGEKVLTTRFFTNENSSLFLKHITGELKLYTLNSFNIQRPDGTKLFSF